MQLSVFRAWSPYEVGDQITSEDGQVHIITDIVALHSIKMGKVTFAYELDGSGNLVWLECAARTEEYT